MESTEMKDAMNYVQSSVGKRDEETVPVAEALITEELPAGQSQYQFRSQHRNAAQIPLDKIIADPDQPRKVFTEGDLQNLADSLQERGQLQPIRVRWDDEKQTFIILMGERRFRAAQRIGWEKIDAIVHDQPLTEDQRLELALIENCVRVDLNPIEQAESFQSLMKNKNLSGRALAKELNLDRNTINRAVALLKLPTDIQQHISKGRINAAIARELVKITDEDKQRELVDQCLSRTMTSGDTAAAINEAKGDKPRGGKSSAGTKKNFTTATGHKLIVSHRRRTTNSEIIESLKEVITLLESDGRTRRKAA